MKLFILLLITFYSIESRALESCTVSVINFVAAFETIGEKLLHLPVKWTPFSLRRNQEIYLICPGNFEKNTFSDSAWHKTVKMTCGTDGYLRYGPYNSSYSEDSFYGDLTCLSGDFNVYIQPSELCQETNFILAYEIKDQIVPVIEVCYNLQLLKLEYLHYVNNQQFHIVNPMSIQSTLKVGDIPVNSPSNHFFTMRDDINFKLRDGFDLKSSFVRYSILDLEQVSSFKKSSFSNIADLVRITWLKSLKEGYTLKMFLKLLEKKSLEAVYDVYVGASGKVQVPESFKSPCEKVSKVDIPLYIWFYLKPKVAGEELVIIGVNSPFIDVDKSKDFVFCEDICDEVPWLEEFGNLRKKPNLGYFFCCRADELVRKNLDGFPRLVVNETSTEQPDSIFVL